MYRRVLIGIVVVAVVAVMSVAALGCGNDSPSAAVEEFLKAAEDKDCEKMVDLIDLEGAAEQGLPLDRDDLIQSCEAESGLGDVVDYQIISEEIDGDEAEVAAEVTVKEDDEEVTQTDTLKLVKKNGDWKISTF
ncbi:MAG: DUF4878 domain-containing protein [Thermoleophilia bacterium]|nr:DUF4878 domain-containing protein [Thermoleophilia bacterium]